MKVYILKQTDSNYMQEMKETVGLMLQDILLVVESLD